jgi:hypothetical protein
MTVSAFAFVHSKERKKICICVFFRSQGLKRLVEHKTKLLDKLQKNELCKKLIAGLMQRNSFVQ